MNKRLIIRCFNCKSPKVYQRIGYDKKGKPFPLYRCNLCGRESEVINDFVYIGRYQFYHSLEMESAQNENPI
jgi:hypothetical protein